MIRIGIALFLLLLSFGLGLASESYCINQDGDYFCLSSDTTCVYVQDNTVETVDTDTDGWTNSCDAFVDDSTEWFDLDADGCGSNEDANDLDPQVADCNIVTPQQTTEVETKIALQESSTSEDQPRRYKRNNCVPHWECGDWGVCDDNVQFRTCVEIIGCERIVEAPAVSRSCEVAQQTLQGIEEEIILPPAQTFQNETEQTIFAADGLRISFAPVLIVMVLTILVLLIINRKQEQGDLIL